MTARSWLAMFWLHPRRPEWKSRWFRLGRLLNLFLYAYLTLGIVLVLAEDELVFRPKAYQEFWSAPPKDAAPLEVTLPLGDGVSVHAWWFEPPGWSRQRGALLHCHGHGCNLSHVAGSALQWSDRLGRGVLLFDYPGFGKSAGTATEDGCYSAAQVAFDWIQTKKGVADIVVYGHSMGGAVAIDLASHRPVRALIVTSSFTTMPDAASVLVPIYPTSWLMHNRFNNLTKIAQCTAPTFFAHGSADGRVPIGQGRQLFEICGTKRKHFHVVKGGSHDLERNAEVLEAAKRFLDVE